MMNLSRLPMDIVLTIYEYENPVISYMKKNVLKINQQKNFITDYLVERMIDSFCKQVSENLDVEFYRSYLEYKYEIVNAEYPDYLTSQNFKIYCKIKEYELYDEDFINELYDNMKEYFVIFSKDTYMKNIIERTEDDLWTVRYHRIDEMVNRRLTMKEKTFDNMVNALCEDANEVIKDLLKGYLDEEEYNDAIADLAKDIEEERGPEIFDGNSNDKDELVIFDSFCYNSYNKRFTFYNDEELEYIVYSVDKYVFENV